MWYLRSGRRVAVADGWMPAIGHWENYGKGTGKARPSAEDRGSWKLGGAGRNRTDDLYNAIVALSQLSYGPMGTAGCGHRRRPAGGVGREIKYPAGPRQGKSRDLVAVLDAGLPSRPPRRGRREYRPPGVPVVLNLLVRPAAGTHFS